MATDGILSSVTRDLVMRALDAASLRHSVLAANVANASSPDFRPLRVNFEQQLAMVRADLLQRDDPSAARRALTNTQPTVEPDPAYAATGEQVRLDDEVSKMMRNAVHYQALLAAMDKSGSIVRMAVKEGRS